jgi:heme/copper-type cytochrome/quinol oxidase subunit 1
MVSQALRTTDPKLIGRMYMLTALAFFALGGAMALLMRLELARPGRQFLSQEQYNQLFTMHGTIMLLLFATPIVFAFANLVVPLQIGAPDVAFPRLNAFSGSSPRAEPRTSAGSPTRRSPTRPTHPGPARTSGSLGWQCPVWGRS